MYLLTKGDIIIFKAEDNWFSKAIAVLTGSDVCHAAMAYSENSIVEVGANGIIISHVDIQEGDEVYVLRLESEPDPAPLIRRADAYLTAETRYDFPGLFLLAGILIYQYIIPTPKLLKTVNHIFDAALLYLDKMIQHAMKYKSRAMVCSQLIYQIFHDCGDEYRIQISKGCLWNSSPDHFPGAIRLIEHLNPNSDDAFKTVVPSDTDVTIPDLEALAKELYILLSEENFSGACQDHQEKTVTDISSVIKGAEGFLSRLKYFLKLIDCDTPIDALFVTPADILYHSSNLKREKVLTLKRIHP